MRSKQPPILEHTQHLELWNLDNQKRFQNKPKSFRSPNKRPKAVANSTGSHETQTFAERWSRTVRLLRVDNLIGCYFANDSHDLTLIDWFTSQIHSRVPSYYVDELIIFRELGIGNRELLLFQYKLELHDSLTPHPVGIA